MDIQHPPFTITSVTWHEIANKLSPVNINKLEDLFNQNLQLTHYGGGVQHLTFIYIAVFPNNKLHKEATNYFPKEKKLVLYRKLPYKKVNSYSNEEVLRLMAETFLKNVATLPTANIPDFNHFQLTKDVEKLFIENGWVVSKNDYPIRRRLKANTLAAFLLSKGWIVKSNTVRYQVLYPPKHRSDLKFMQLYLPISSNSNNGKYERALTDLILLLSKLYEIDELELELLFSKNGGQIERDIEMMRGMGAYLPSSM